MRICILALANPLTWTAHFVKAFRRFGEVLTVGPAFGPEYLVTYGIADQPEMARKNDITSHLHGGMRLMDLLPAGWEPELIVAISDFGRPLSTDMTGYACPKVYLSIDTWQSPIDYADAIYFDAVFVAQRVFVPRLRATGSRHVFWLPLACDPQLHYPEDSAPAYDVSFAGSIAAGVHEERRRLLEALKRTFRVAHVEHIYGGAFRHALCQGSIIFNHSAVNDLNMRIFEGLAMGRPLLTNGGAQCNGLLDLLEDRKHLFVYHTAEDLISLTQEILSNPELAREVAAAGRAEVLGKHTYVHRVKTILDTVAELTPGFPSIHTRPAFPPESLLFHLPVGARRVLDVDGQLLPERESLAHLGMEVAGLSDEGGADLTWPNPAWTNNSFDAAVIHSLSRHACPPEASLAEAHRVLAPGGTLLLKIGSREIENLAVALEANAMIAWFRMQNFHVTNLTYRVVDAAQSNVLFHIIARKRGQTLRAVVDEGMAELPFQYRPPYEVIDQFPEDL